MQNPFKALRERFRRAIKALLTYSVVAVLSIAGWVGYGPSASEADVLVALQSLTFGTADRPDAGRCLGESSLSTVGVFGLPSVVRARGEGAGRWVRYTTACVSSFGAPVEIYWDGRARPVKIQALGGHGSLESEELFAARLDE